MIDRLFGFVDRPVQRIERSSSPLVLFACLAALLLLQMWFLRWTGNEEDYFQLAYRAFAPEKFSQFSAVVDSSHARIVPLYLLGALVQLLGYDAAHAVGRLLMTVLYAAGLAYFFSALKLSAWDALLVLVLFLAAGQELFGGEWLFDGIESKTVAYALVFFAFGLALRRRWIAALVVGGVATYMHFLVGGFWTMVILLGQWLETRSWREALRGLVVYVIVTLPLAGLILWDELAWAGTPGTELADKIYAARNMLHVVPFTALGQLWDWFPGFVNTLVLLLALAVIASRYRERSPQVTLVLRSAVFGLAFLVAALGPAYLDRHTQVLGKLFLFRPSSLALLLALTTIVTLLFGRLTEEARAAKALIVCALVLAFSWTLVKKNVEWTRHTAAAFPERGELIAAVVSHTAPGDLVLIDPGLDGDRDYMTLVRLLPRPTLANWKFVPTNPAEIIRWQSYMDLRREVFANGCGTRMPVPVRWLVALEPGTAERLKGCGQPVWQKGSVALIPVP
ncbi:MAG TPA: hypothetical protein VJQ44_04350 [Gemmatimonadales bacterium]|nr:hypothetical protein [Gemmatimonadales bacterium]